MISRRALWLGAGALALGSLVLGSRVLANKRRLVVFAASSLTEAFTALKRSFEASHPEVEVELVFAGTQVLRMQIQAGARADLIASAHPEQLQALFDTGDAQAAQTLVHNRLVVIVPEGRVPRPWTELGEIESWIMGSAQVPIGRYSQRLLDALQRELGAAAVEQIRSRVRSIEPNVRLVRAKIAMGQAEAAVVYKSDLRPGVPVQELVLPASLQIRARYEVAALLESPEPDLAREFIAFARSPAGQALMVQEGFEARGAADAI